MTSITAGATNVTLYVYFVDDDGGTAPGEPTTGLLFSDIETGGSASYVRQGAARTDVTLKTLASASTAHDDGGFILVDDTNMPGLYRVDIPDAAFAAGADFVIIHMVAAGANNSITRPLLVMLPDVDFGDTVRAGLTALPNAAADAAGGLPISDAGGLDLDGVLSGNTPQSADNPTAVENADALLNRDMSAISDGNARSPLNALRFLRNKWSISGTTLTVTKEDDSTSAWTSTVTEDASANPITGNDPA